MKSTPLLNTWLALTLLGLALIVLPGCATLVTAPPFVTCGAVLTDSRDGHTYHTVQIGAQCWLSENLKYLPAVSPTSDFSGTVPYYYIYDNQGRSIDLAKLSANYQNFGVLYNWPAAMSACPIGWHLPDDAEWTQLVDYVQTQYQLFNDWVHVEGVGNALKSCRQVDSPLGGACRTTAAPRWASYLTPPPGRDTLAVNAGAQYGVDTVGFSALPGGRFAYGTFRESGFAGFWWSATDYYSTRAWYRFVRHEFSDVTRSTFDKVAGHNVRCLRD